MLALFLGGVLSPSSSISASLQVFAKWPKSPRLCQFVRAGKKRDRVSERKKRVRARATGAGSFHNGTGAKTSIRKDIQYTYA